MVGYLGGARVNYREVKRRTRRFLALIIERERDLGGWAWDNFEEKDHERVSRAILEIADEVARGSVGREMMLIANDADAQRMDEDEASPLSHQDILDALHDD